MIYIDYACIESISAWILQSWSPKRKKRIVCGPSRRMAYGGSYTITAHAMFKSTQLNGLCEYAIRTRRMRLINAFLFSILCLQVNTHSRWNGERLCGRRDNTWIFTADECIRLVRCVCKSQQWKTDTESQSQCNNCQATGVYDRMMNFHAI